MKFGLRLFARFGLFAQKSDAPDAFELRLQRIGRREKRHIMRRALFRPIPEPVEA